MGSPGSSASWCSLGKAGSTPQATGLTHPTSHPLPTRPGKPDMPSSRAHAGACRAPRAQAGSDIEGKEPALCNACPWLGPDEPLLPHVRLSRHLKAADSSPEGWAGPCPPAHKAPGPHFTSTFLTEHSLIPSVPPDPDSPPPAPPGPSHLVFLPPVCPLPDKNQGDTRGA